MASGRGPFAASGQEQGQKAGSQFRPQSPVQRAANSRAGPLDARLAYRSIVPCTGLGAIERAAPSELGRLIVRIAPEGRVIIGVEMERPPGLHTAVLDAVVPPTGRGGQLLSGHQAPHAPRCRVDPQRASRVGSAAAPLTKVGARERPRPRGGMDPVRRTCPRPSGHTPGSRTGKTPARGRIRTPTVRSRQNRAPADSGAWRVASVSSGDVAPPCRPGGCR